MTKWIQHLKAVYKDMKKKDKNATLRDAMKQAKKSYKKEKK